MKNAIRKKIKEIKKELMVLEVIRPGKLSKQKRGKGRYNYLSYTFRNESHTEYVRGKYVDEIRKETEAYEKFKKLTDEWIELSINLSKLKLKE